MATKNLEVLRFSNYAKVKDLRDGLWFVTWVYYMVALECMVACVIFRFCVLPLRQFIESMSMETQECQPDSQSPNFACH